MTKIRMPSAAPFEGFVRSQAGCVQRPDHNAQISESLLPLRQARTTIFPAGRFDLVVRLLRAGGLQSK